MWLEVVIKTLMMIIIIITTTTNTFQTCVRPCRLLRSQAIYLSKAQQIFRTEERTAECVLGSFFYPFC